MRIDILTLFPEYFESPLEQSLLQRAQKNSVCSIKAHNIRDHATPPHFQVDDKSFGGGPGMVLKPEPLKKSIDTLKREDSKVIYLSPQGTPLTQEKCIELSQEKHLILICGHYEGIDERIIETVDEEISIGDYILTNGCPAALVLIDSVVRLLPNVVGKQESIEHDSFKEHLFDHPHYTQPQDFHGQKVPDVLISGDHAKIEKFREERAIEKTRKKRPDLYKKYLELKL